MKELQLNIISAEKRIFSGAVSSVIVPGISGKFGVYPDHAPLISPLREGTIVYTAGSKEETVAVNGGIAEVMQNVVTICVA
jgi:F-type H+-transporting ATPase subunit epsilon